jgi:TolB protein
MRRRTSGRQHGQLDTLEDTMQRDRSIRDRGLHPAALVLLITGAALAAACDDMDQPPPLAPEMPTTAFARGGNGGNNGRILVHSQRDEPGLFEIYSMNPDGSAVSRLTHSTGDDGDGTWSPDGKRIAFLSLRHDPKGEIYVMNADGTGVTRLTNTIGIDFEPRWSKDGKRIVFVTSRHAADPANPSFQELEIYTMNADGTGLTRLTDNATGDLDPDWSPDGKRIVFTSDRDAASPGTAFDLYAMNTDGSRVTRLTFEGRVCRLPFWAPGGKEIAFTADDGIYKMNADGTGLTFLTGGSSELSSVWSDDGKQIAFSSARDGDLEVYVMNADGTGITRLTFSPGDDAPSAWRR